MHSERCAPTYIEPHAFPLEPHSLIERLAGPAAADRALGIDDPMPRDRGRGAQRRKCVADEPRLIAKPGSVRNLAIRRDPPAGDLSDYRVHTCVR